MVSVPEVTGNKIACPHCGWPVSRVTRNDAIQVPSRHMERRVKRNGKTGQPMIYKTKRVCPASLTEEL